MVYQLAIALTLSFEIAAFVAPAKRKSGKEDSHSQFLGRLLYKMGNVT